MAEDLELISGTKEEKYIHVIPQIKALIGDEKNTYANLANTSAALKHFFNFFWVGFYLVEDAQLVLGPFQGPVACTRIEKGRGVCGTAWQQKTTIVVDNVDEFPGHIACSALTKSEIVVPLVKNGQVVGVLDIDSENEGFFDQVDSKYLNELVAWLVSVI